MSDPDERLGRFRADLQVQVLDKGGARAFRVVDPRRGLAHEMWEIEHTVASMMDGRRTAEEVAKACAGRGFAVSAAHVKSFHRELKGMGFVVVGNDAAPSAGGGGEDHRSDAQRFIDEAQIYMAAGRYELAQGLFEAALQIDDSDIDADIGLARCRKLLGAASADGGLSEATLELADSLADDIGEIVAPPSPPSPPTPAPPMRAPMQAAARAPAADGAGGDGDDLPLVAGVPAMGPPVGPGVVPGGPAVPNAGPRPPARPKRTALVVAGVVGVVVVAAVVALGLSGGDAAPDAPSPAVAPIEATPPRPTVVAGPARAAVVQIANPVLASVPSPAAGRFTKVFVKPGASVAKAQRLLQVTRTKGGPVIVVAPQAGAFSPALALGKPVKKGDVIGNVVDGAVWQLTARFASAPAPDARACRLIDGGNEAVCQVVSVDAAVVVATVGASAAPWLSAATSGAILELSPPPP